MPDKMTDDELRTYVGAKITASVGYMGGTLSQERLKAERYYKGEPFGDEQVGRSQVVSRDVAEAIDSALPALLKVFTSVNELVKFEPRLKMPPQGAPPPMVQMLVERSIHQAKQATDYVNWIFWEQNDGFLILHNWFKDALLKKLGVLKVWWLESDDRSRERYTGLTDEQLTMLLGDDAVEIVEKDEYPDPNATAAGLMQPPGASSPPAGMGASPPASPAAGAAMLYDVVLRRSAKKGRVHIAVVPPDEFLFDHRSVSADDSTMLCHHVKKTVTELLEMGFDADEVDRLGNGGDGGQDFNQERIERFSDEDAYPYRADNEIDPSMREVWLNETYIKIDFDGDGLAELRQVYLGGESDFTLLGNEEADDHPFITITPIPMPHKMVGQSLADQTQDIQEIKSALWRGALNSVYLANAPRHGIVDGQVNLDDMLNVRAGGVVRMKAPGMIFPIPTLPVAADAYQMIQYADGVRETRTGVRRWATTMDAEEINPYDSTATGAVMKDDASRDRLELMARIFAQTGIRKVCKRILELVCKHQDKPEIIRLRGQFVAMDPREWDEGMNATPTVGLGHGNNDKLLQQAMSLGPIYEKIAAMQGGFPAEGQGAVATSQNFYNWLSTIIERSQLRFPERYFSDPEGKPLQLPAPPQDNSAQVEQIKLDQAKIGLQVAQTKAQEGQADAQANALQAKQEMASSALEHQERMSRLEMDNKKNEATIENLKAAALANLVKSGIAVRGQTLDEAMAAVQSLLDVHSAALDQHQVMNPPEPAGNGASA